MTKNKIAFFKSLSFIDSTFPIKVLNNPKYDENLLINKDAIIKAVDKYHEKIGVLAKGDNNTIPNFDINIEGHFLAQNIPEVPSIVIDDICSNKKIAKILRKSDVSHIALSTYATGLDKTIELIKIIQTEFSDIELYIGGVGVVYPHLQELMNPKNICRGDGVNWLRKKFKLKLLSPDEYSIPEIHGKFPAFPLPVKTAFLITQIGCPNNCDFCITPNFLKYNPFSKSDKIIKYLENLSSKSNKDIFIFIVEPNAFFPEHTWKKVFNHFLENPKNIENRIFIAFEGSLSHLNKFDLEKIQTKSPIKFLFISFGIESTLEGGYLKNQGDPVSVVERLNSLGIVTKQNYLVGLPFHTEKTINLEIKNNLKFNPDLFSVFNFKPIPGTPLYQRLKFENRLYDRKLPPEFLYAFGFQPFNHEHLGGGFNILEHLFKAIYMNEKHSIDIYGNFARKLLDLFTISNSSKIKWAAKLFMKLNKLYFKFFQARMPKDITEIYKENMVKIKQKYKRSVFNKSFV